VSVELRPLGVSCNIGCEYCYQQPQRDAGNVGRPYDIDAMKVAVEQEGGPFTLFGGEPLLVPIADLESLWAWGFARHGANGIQTNGVLVNDAHVELFRKYRVHVGISMDGPGELNDIRWAGTVARTREATRSSQAAIERLCREHEAPSIIVTLHRGNATRERLPRLVDWVRQLAALGVTAVRLHLLEVDDEAVRHRFALSARENIEALEAFEAIEPSVAPLRFDLFGEMRALLVGQDQHASCVWHACDPYTTRAVRGIEGTGQRSNCGRTQKDGVDYVKADHGGHERYLALFHTPQECGGCQGCRFFLMCKGQCPGTAIDGDWRNRTEHCAVWLSLFERLERGLVHQGWTPLSLHPGRSRVEAQFVRLWSSGATSTIAAVVADLNSKNAR
jgi:uncharacterized protein